MSAIQSVTVREAEVKSAKAPFSKGITDQEKLIERIDRFSTDYFARLPANAEQALRKTKEMPYLKEVLNSKALTADEKINFLCQFTIYNTCYYTEGAPYLLGIPYQNQEIAEALLRFRVSVATFDLLLHSYWWNEHKQRELIEIHAKAGGSLDYQDPQGQTLLHRQPKLIVAAAAVEHKANLALQDIWGDTALHVAVSRKDSALVHLLCKAGANPNARNLQGQTPLFRARQQGDLHLLINAGANIHALDDDGNTPLHVLSRWSKREVVRTLIGYNADLKIRNKAGKTPFEYVSEGSSISAQENVSLIREAWLALMRKESEAEKKAKAAAEEAARLTQAKATEIAKQKEMDLKSSCEANPKSKIPPMLISRVDFDGNSGCDSGLDDEEVMPDEILFSTPPIRSSSPVELGQDSSKQECYSYD